MPKTTNDNWENARAGFKPLLQEALDIRNKTRKEKGIWGLGENVEKELIASGWLDRANSTMKAHKLEVLIKHKPAEKGMGIQLIFGLNQVIVKQKGGKGGFLLVAILDPENPEKVSKGDHKGTGCCC